MRGFYCIVILPFLTSVVAGVTPGLKGRAQVPTATPGLKGRAYVPTVPIVAPGLSGRAHVPTVTPGLKERAHAHRADPSGPPVSAQQSDDGRDRDPRTLRVEQWLKAIVDHRPGEFDEAAQRIARLGYSEMQSLSLDTTTITLLIRDQRLSWFTMRKPGQRTVETIRYTPRQLARMRVLACAAAGIVRERICIERQALGQLDDDLLRLGDIVAAARTNGDANYLLRRGAMLHTDVAMLSGAETFTAQTSAQVGGAQRITISVDDGRETSTFFGVIHWEIARALLDAVRPGNDPMVRAWYHATAAWMQARGYHENTDHIASGLRLFPKDADLLFYGGCEHESFGRPSIQAAARSVSLPPGFQLLIKSADDELREAETMFRRSLAVDPDHREARLRLGRVLLARGRTREAAEELRRAHATADDDVMQYFASLFLGAAEEGLGNYDAADALYSRASALHPSAQSPHIARSALARRRGDRAGALRGIERVFELAAARPDGDDPWWTYDLAAGRHAGELLERLKALLPEVQP